MLTRSSHARRGRAFTLPEVLVTLAIMAALAAVLIPAVMSRLGNAEAAAVIDTLKQLRVASFAYRDNVGRYPERLAQLQARPSSTVGTLDVCDGTLPQVAIDSWKGPYIGQRFTETGVQVGGSTVRNEIKRDPATTASLPEGFMIFEVDGVDEAIARQIDNAFDPLTSGAADFTRGSVTWASNLLRFWVAVRGC